MTLDECNAAVRRLNLTPTNVPTVRRDADGNPHNIPDWARYTPEERVRLIRRLAVAVRGFDDQPATAALTSMSAGTATHGS